MFNFGLGVLYCDLTEICSEFPMSCPEGACSVLTALSRGGPVQSGLFCLGEGEAGVCAVRSVLSKRGPTQMNTHN